MLEQTLSYLKEQLAVAKDKASDIATDLLIHIH